MTNTLFIFPFLVIELSYFMGNSCLTLKFFSSLRNFEGTFIRIQSEGDVIFFAFTGLFDVDLNEFFGNELGHFISLFFIFQHTSIIECSFKQIYGFVFIILLVKTFPQAEQRN